MLVLVLITILNVVLSYWNAYVCGKAWEESKAIGGVIRLLVWCGAIQSAVGFSSVILLTLAVLARLLVPDVFTDVYFQGTISLWYVSVIFPVIGSGFCITVESWMTAYRERSLLQIGRASWNTFAQVHNTVGMINNLGPAFNAIGKAFGQALSAPSRGKDDAKGKAAILGLMLMIVIVILAIAGGALITAAIIKKYAGTVPLPTRADDPTLEGAIRRGQERHGPRLDKLEGRYRP